jgi:hypothetical protein
MVLQLIRDELGNYVYKDPRETSTPPITSQEFEAYTGGDKTTLAGTTDLGSQTQALMRETPGETRLVTDPVTGETKTESDIKPINVQQKDFVPPSTQDLIESPLEKAARIAQQFPMKQQTGASPQEFLGQIQSMQDKAIKAERMNTILKGGVDLGISYLNMGRTVPGTTGPITPLTSLTATPVGASTLGGVGIAGGAGYLVSRALGGDKKESTAAGAGAAIGTAVGGPVGGVVGGVIGRVLGGRVICTELHRQKLMSKEDYLMDLKFTETHMIPKYGDAFLQGYWSFAVPAVKKMRQSKLHTKFWKHIACNRAQDIKWRLGKGKFNIFGRAYSLFFENLCWAIGKIKKTKVNFEELYT